MGTGRVIIAANSRGAEALPDGSGAGRDPALDDERFETMPLWLRITVMVVFFAAGYQRATWFRGRYGRTQWGWPPAVWGALCALAFLLGLILLAVSERTERGKAARAADGGLSGGWATQASPSAQFTLPHRSTHPGSAPTSWGQPQP